MNRLFCKPYYPVFLMSTSFRITSYHVCYTKLLRYRSCVFALSVKLSNSAEPYEKRVRPEIFGSIIDNADEAFFKFTVDAEGLASGLEKEIKEILYQAPKCQVMCMPKGGSKEEVESNTEAVIELCKRCGYSYSDRLHIRIWDQNKGV